MVKKYYSVPTQVNFPQYIDPDNDNSGIVIFGGIAYDDFIICGECGGTIPIEEIEEEFGNDAIVDLDWCDISSSILGD